MNFEKLTPELYPRLKPYFRNQRHSLCTYSLPAMLAWSHSLFCPYGAMEDGTLVVKGDFPREPEKCHLLLPISPEKEHSPEDLAALAEKTGVGAFWFVPRDYLKHYGRKRVKALFEIEEQPEFEDYVYRTEDLADLRGNRYSKKRNLVHQFEKSHLDKGRVIVEAILPEAFDECVVFLDRWCEERDCGVEKNQDLACEWQAAVNAIDQLEQTDARGLLLRIDGEVSAFAVASWLTPQMGALHFEKAFTRVKGLYQYFDRQCARELFEGLAYINKESDMLIPGLAKAKRSYHPVMRIKSYRLTLKTS